MKTSALIALLLIMQFISCSTKNTEIMKPYVIEITSFKYKSTVDAAAFWKEDARIQTNYTSQQPGFISRESGYSDDMKEVIVIVRWKTEADAGASMQKFMEDESVVDFVNMIEGSTMKMTRYSVK